jgi:Squalene/phytoene synthase
VHQACCLFFHIDLYKYSPCYDSLLQLVMESGGMSESTNPKAIEAARLVGVCHGLTNALRTSIPVVSTTGKLIIPAELTTKYGVKSPRYLLSALGQGDEKCLAAMRKAVEDIASRAKSSLEQARGMRESVIAEKGGDKAVTVLLPGLASETFLSRLADRKYELTDRSLRNVSSVEHAMCASRMVMAYYQKQY